MEVRLDIPEANRICNTVRATTFNSGVGAGFADVPHFLWTGTNWALSSSATDAPMDSLTCN
jgi:hypothetical protein